MDSYFLLQYFEEWEGSAACQTIRRVIVGLSVGLLHLGHYKVVTALIDFLCMSKASQTTNIISVSVPTCSLGLLECELVYW